MNVTPDQLRQLTAEVHRSIRYKKGLEGWQVEVDPIEGDCDSFAMSLAVRLQRLGLVPYLVVYDTWKGEQHCIVRVSIEGELWFADPTADRVTRDKQAKDMILFPPSAWHLIKKRAAETA